MLWGVVMVWFLLGGKTDQPDPRVDGFEKKAFKEENSTGIKWNVDAKWHLPSMPNLLPQTEQPR